jgi:glutamate-ammonia-ligase adenylyltransferase
MARKAKKTPKKTSGKTSKSAPNKPVAKKSERPLAAAIARAPQLVDRKAAQARLAEWLADIGKGAAGKASSGKALKQLIAGAPKVEALLLGLADGSPYLWELASAEPNRLLAVLEADPAERLTELLA